jgi:hypothetical protein
MYRPAQQPRTDHHHRAVHERSLQRTTPSRPGETVNRKGGQPSSRWRAAAEGRPYTGRRQRVRSPGPRRPATALRARHASPLQQRCAVRQRRAAGHRVAGTQPRAPTPECCVAGSPVCPVDSRAVHERPLQQNLSTTPPHLPLGHAAASQRGHAPNQHGLPPPRHRGKRRYGPVPGPPRLDGQASKRTRRQAQGMAVRRSADGARTRAVARIPPVGASHPRHRRW